MKRLFVSQNSSLLLMSMQKNSNLMTKSLRMSDEIRNFRILWLKQNFLISFSIRLHAVETNLNYQIQSDWWSSLKKSVEQTE